MGQETDDMGQDVYFRTIDLVKQNSAETVADLVDALETSKSTTKDVIWQMKLAIMHSEMESNHAL